MEYCARSVSHAGNDSSFEEARAAAWLQHPLRCGADNFLESHRRAPLGRFNSAASHPEQTITMNLRDAYRDINLLFSR